MKPGCEEIWAPLIAQANLIPVLYTHIQKLFKNGSFKMIRVRKCET